ncbi:penicillin-binding protein 1C [Sphingobacteriaceae bacterium]|nr:penicillin-binding protein 1C [Sphingobacteriaceae bacterium]
MNLQLLKKTRRKIALKKWSLRTLLLLCLLFFSWYWVCLPDELFHGSTSTVLMDKDGHLLGARIAADGQWRFSPGNSIPAKFESCLLEFEDRNFYKHCGISCRGIGRAMVQNIKYRRVVSGGSTLSMQLARIMLKNPKRTFPEKIVEMIVATRMEIRFTKKEILQYYCSNAPFGNNVVGLEAASWRYFGRDPRSLSWAENATLAVLPNAPGLIYPGKNHKKLLEKRNRLLKRLLDVKKIDSTSYLLAVSEPLPHKPLPLPQTAPHILVKLIKQGFMGKTITSTLDNSLQQKSSQLLQSHSERLIENKIYNGAVIITSVKTGKILAYVGNTRSADNEHGNDVDCVTASRSTGSILKPFLYAKCLEDGIITPCMLIPDIPTQYGSFSPKNFTKQYDGAVAANKALARSLNIPMVRLLNDYGLEKFHRDLKNYGLSTLHKPAKHYGLSLILGGAEARLDELSRAYTQMAQELSFGKSREILLVEHKKKSPTSKNSARVKTNRACIYSTFQAMVDVNRPDEDGNWRAFASAQKIAWKTGTSFGFRDAWAIGITPDYVVAVWIGNADGEGRPGLTGIKAAAPLLFDLFAQLPKSSSWFSEPVTGMSKILICSESGHRASDLCEKTELAKMPANCLNTTACLYHQLVHLTKNNFYRVDSECEAVYNMKHVSWFILPPLIERYYKFNHPNYQSLPDFKPECLAKISERSMTLLYPRPNSSIYVPIEIDGNAGRTIFEATHRNTGTKIYWHLDDNFIGETKEIHQLALNPSFGKHKLMLLDENGISITAKFETLAK